MLKGLNSAIEEAVKAGDSEAAAMLERALEDATGKIKAFRDELAKERAAEESEEGRTETGASQRRS